MRNYVEPFFGSGAVLLGRPHDARVETVNDKDAYLANFWRAVQHDPEQVASFADSPVNESDLHARHRWLVETAAERVAKTMDDPDYFDAKVAGWWVWGQCLWIGSGWCMRPGGIHANETSGDKVLDWAVRPDLSRQIPDVSGNDGAVGRGILASGFNTPTAGLYDYMGALSDRLRRVRVCCGDWKRVVGPAVTTCISTTGLFLDPPYHAPGTGRSKVYNHDTVEIWNEVKEWAVQNGDDPNLRIALCGYEGAHDIPASWSEVAWKSAGGYGSSARGQANRARERIWFSPHCLPATADQHSLAFDPEAA